MQMQPNASSKKIIDGDGDWSINQRRHNKARMIISVKIHQFDVAVKMESRSLQELKRLGGVESVLTLLENKNATVAQNAGFILANCSSEIDQIASQIADCGVQQLSSLTRLLTGSDKVQRKNVLRILSNCSSIDHTTFTSKMVELAVPIVLLRMIMDATNQEQEEPTLEKEDDEYTSRFGLDEIELECCTLALGNLCFENVAVKHQLLHVEDAVIADRSAYFGGVAREPGSPAKLARSPSMLSICRSPFLAAVLQLWSHENEFIRDNSITLISNLVQNHEGFVRRLVACSGSLATIVKQLEEACTLLFENNEADKSGDEEEETSLADDPVLIALFTIPAVCSQQSKRFCEEFRVEPNAINTLFKIIESISSNHCTNNELQPPQPEISFPSFTRSCLLAIKHVLETKDESLDPITSREVLPSWNFPKLEDFKLPGSAQDLRRYILHHSRWFRDLIYLSTANTEVVSKIASECLQIIFQDYTEPAVTWYLMCLDALPLIYFFRDSNSVLNHMWFTCQSQYQQLTTCTMISPYYQLFAHLQPESNHVIKALSNIANSLLYLSGMHSKVLPIPEEQRESYRIVLQNLLQSDLIRSITLCLRHENGASCIAPVILELLNCAIICVQPQPIRSSSRSHEQASVEELCSNIKRIIQADEISAREVTSLSNACKRLTMELSWNSKENADEVVWMLACGLHLIVQQCLQ